MRMARGTYFPPLYTNNNIQQTDDKNYSNDNIHINQLSTRVWGVSIPFGVLPYASRLYLLCICRVYIRYNATPKGPNIKAQMAQRVGLLKMETAASVQLAGPVEHCKLPSRVWSMSAIQRFSHISDTQNGLPYIIHFFSVKMLQIWQNSVHLKTCPKIS